MLATLNSQQILDIYSSILRNIRMWKRMWVPDRWEVGGLKSPKDWVTDPASQQALAASIAAIISQLEVEALFSGGC